MADQAVGNYLTEAIVPEVTREDPRYYTLGHGGFFKRTAYAVSRLLVTRTDSGINLSEIVGNGAGAGISNLYYPSQERTWTKTGQKWATQIALDGVSTRKTAGEADFGAGVQCGSRTETAHKPACLA